MSSTTAPPPIPQIEITQPEIAIPTPAATPQKRKRSVTSNTAPQRSSKMARLDTQVPPADESLGSTVHYGVYMHDLLKEPSNASPQLVTISTGFNSTYEAMRKHAAEQIDANVHWGATKELNTNHLYEILDSKNRVLLRYELDAVFPAGEDANGIRIWNRASASPAPPVHYGMYIDLHCNTKERAEHFFIGGFKSLGEATYAMKQSAAMYLHSRGGAKLYEKSIEVMNEKGQLQRRFTIQKCRRSENGSFVREEDWHLEQDSTDSKVPVIRLPTPETSELSAPPIAQPVALPVTPQAVPQGPAPVASKPQATRGTRRQSQRLQPHLQPANNIEEEQSKTKPQAKVQVQAPRDLTPHCTCRLPDDGSLMIGCDNNKCLIGWYHGRCINIHQAMPENEEWFCEMCTRELENKKAQGVDTLAVNTAGKTPVKKGGHGGAKAKAKKRKLG